MKPASPSAVVRFAAGCLALLAACHAPRAAGEPLQPDGPELRVATFNIRYGTANDGEHAWPNRRDQVAGRIRDLGADVLALQEALAFQLDELAPVLAGYRKIGQHRDGGLDGEFSGLYVLEETTRVVDQGELWLSPTPNEVASRGWDAALPRMAVWADMQLLAGGPVVRVYGTHYDHRGAEARRMSSELILADAANRPAAIVMGDLNATEEQSPLQAYFEQGFRSAFRALNPDDARGTFNGWQDPEGGRRIDHILWRGPLWPRRARIHSGRVGDLFPSDHDAVSAHFLLQRPATADRRAR